MAEPIDPALARALDAFAVPDLPADFADRVVAAALDLPPADSATAVPPLPRRRRPGQRWLRGVAVGSAVLATGLFSLSAAAMGWLGEPVRLSVRHALDRVPVVAHLVDRIVPHHPAATAPVAVPVARPVVAPLHEPAPPLPRNEIRPASPVIHPPLVLRPLPHRAVPMIRPAVHPHQELLLPRQPALAPVAPRALAEPAPLPAREPAIDHERVAPREAIGERRAEPEGLHEPAMQRPGLDFAARRARWQARQQARREAWAARGNRADTQAAAPARGEDHRIERAQRPENRANRPDRPQRGQHPGRGPRGPRRRRG